MSHVSGMIEIISPGHWMRAETQAKYHWIFPTAESREAERAEKAAKAEVIRLKQVHVRKTRDAERWAARRQARAANEV